MKFRVKARCICGATLKSNVYSECPARPYLKASNIGDFKIVELPSFWGAPLHAPLSEGNTPHFIILCIKCLSRLDRPPKYAERTLIFRIINVKE